MTTFNKNKLLKVGTHDIPSDLYDGKIPIAIVNDILQTVINGSIEETISIMITLSGYVSIFSDGKAHADRIIDFLKDCMLKETL